MYNSSDIAAPLRYLIDRMTWIVTGQQQFKSYSRIDSNVGTALNGINPFHIFCIFEPISKMLDQKFKAINCTCVNNILHPVHKPFQRSFSDPHFLRKYKADIRRVGFDMIYI